MRVLTAKEVNFVSGGHIDGQADPYSLSGGFQGTGMPNTSGNSIGDVNYSPPSQEQSCLNGNFVMGAGSLISTVNSVVGGILVAWGLEVMWQMGVSTQEAVIHQIRVLALILVVPALRHQLMAGADRKYYLR